MATEEPTVKVRLCRGMFRRRLSGRWHQSETLSEVEWPDVPALLAAERQWGKNAVTLTVPEDMARVGSLPVWDASRVVGRGKTVDLLCAVEAPDVATRHRWKAHNEAVLAELAAVNIEYDQVTDKQWKALPAEAA